MKVAAILSMLHELPGRPDSSTRKFRGEAPVAWALYRLGRCKLISDSTVICWEDQANTVRPIIEELKAKLSVHSARSSVPYLDGVSASRRWADGWRSGLLGACEFDRGFHGPSAKNVLEQSESDAILLVDPSSGLVDPDLIDQLIQHADAHPEVDFCFSQAAPGLSGVILRKRLVYQLAEGVSHPGNLLIYRPDLPSRDPISTVACAPLATSLARTTHRFTLDSERQIDHIARSTIHLNGQLISTEAEQLLRFLNASPVDSQYPRDLLVELTTRRASSPIYSPISSAKISRPDLTLESAKAIFDEMSAVDDARIALGGVGDPLLHPDFASIVECAHQAGIGAISIETDLLAIEPDAIDRLADLPLDIISVNLPAISIQSYQAVMGVDGFRQVMANLTRLVQRRQASGHGTPLVAPTFVKTAANFAEMDAWYDHWLRVLGCAVIAGPGDFAGQIKDVSLVQMEPPRRRPCVRIANRMTILSDGRIVSCEQDFLGANPIGTIGEKPITDIWTGPMAALRREHSAGNWKCNGLCAACKDWHRP